MQEVKIILMGHLHWYEPQKRKIFTMKIDNNIKVTEILKDLQIPETDIQMVSINGKKSSLGYILEDGDVLEVLPVIAGG